jgi:hypothetical protein
METSEMLMMQAAINRQTKLDNGRPTFKEIADDFFRIKEYERLTQNL